MISPNVAIIVPRVMWLDHRTMIVSSSRPTNSDPLSLVDSDRKFIGKIRLDANRERSRFARVFASIYTH